MRWRGSVSLGLQGRQIALVLLALLPLLVFDVVQIYSRENARVSQEMAASEELAEAIHGGLQQYLDGLSAAALGIGDTIVSHTEPLTPIQVDALLRSEISRRPHLSALSWLDPNGTVLASSDAAIRGQELGHVDYVQQIMNGVSEEAVSNLLLGPSATEVHIGVLQAVRRDDGRLAGMVLVRVDAARLVGVFPLRRSGSRAVGLVDRNGTVAYQNADQMLLADRGTVQPESPVWEALAGRVGRSTEFISSVDGMKRMGVAVPVPSVGWAVFATASVDEVLAEVRAEAMEDLLILLLVVGVSISAALVLGRRMDQPLVALQRAAAAVGRGDLSARVGHSSADDLGATSRVFDRMAGHIEESERRLQDRLRQHEALAALGQLLLSGKDIPELMDEVVHLVSRALQVEFCKVAELKPGDPALLLRAGTGWREGLVGHAFLPGATESQSGYTLTVRKPVVVSDLRAEHRFRGSSLLREHGAVSGISVIIPGPDRPFGALGAYSSEPRRFTHDDVIFLRTVAHALSTALTRRSDERRIATSNEVTRILADAGSPAEAWPQVIRAIGEGLGWDIAVGWTMDASNGAVHCIGSWHREGEALAAFVAKRRQLTLGVGPSGPGWISVAAGWAEDVASDRRYIQREAAREAGLHSAFWVPVLLGDEVHGFLECFATEARFEDKALLQSISVLGSQFGQFIKRKWAEEELRALNAGLERRVAERTAELAAANQELESFSYSVSHDLRAPLRTIEGFGQALLEDFGSELPPEGQDYLHRIRAAASRMEYLIDDLLRLSRLMRAEMRREVVNLTRLAHEAAGELHRLHPDRQVSVDIWPGMMAVGDERLLRVAMQNLLDNAWKFAADVPDATVTVGMYQREEGPVYFVRDNGAGFDMAHVDKIFIPFQRLHPAGKFDGHGIGLATVNRIIHRHGGRVWAEGAVGQGAEFRFTLAQQSGEGA